MENGTPPHDFEDILKETELDSAKMILRLTSELREKELEVASTRTRSFDEIQRNNKAKEAEFEALMRAQRTASPGASRSWPACWWRRSRRCGRSTRPCSTTRSAASARSSKASGNC